MEEQPLRHFQVRRRAPEIAHVAIRQTSKRAREGERGGGVDNCRGKRFWQRDPSAVYRVVGNWRKGVRMKLHNSFINVSSSIVKIRTNPMANISS